MLHSALLSEMISYMISLSLSLIDAAAADQHVCAERGRESGQRENQFSRDLPLSLAHIHAMGICSEFYF